MASTLEVYLAAQVAFLGNTPTAYMMQTTAQATTISTDSALNWQSASNDNWSGWSSGNPSRWTATVAGVYTISGVSLWAAETSGHVITKIAINGVAVQGSDGIEPFNTGSQVSCPTASIPVAMQAGDYAQIIVNQSNGSISTLVSGSIGSSMSVQFDRFL